MFQLTEQMIINQVERNTTYQQGVMYFLNKRVHNFTWNDIDLSVEANVWGQEQYEVEIGFRKDGHIHTMFCTCPAFSSYEGVCKHVVAVLKSTQSYFLKQKALLVKEQNMTNQIFAFFDLATDETTKKQITLEILYEMAEDDRYHQNPTSALSLKIGEERLYVVRSIKNLIEVINKGKSLEFGKNFVFDPHKHCFSSRDAAILDILKELYEAEEIALSSIYGSQPGSIFKGKKVLLTGSSTKRLFEILKDSFFTAVIQGVEYQSVQIKHENIPLAFTLDKVDKDLLLRWQQEGVCIPLTQDGRYFFYKDAIYVPDEKQRKYFLPFYNAFISTKDGIRFSGIQKERFVSEILPYTKGLGKVMIEPKVEETFCEEPLQIEVYLDKVENMITGKVLFIYGEQKIDPFGGGAVHALRDQILIRDVEQEKKVIGILENAEFKVAKDFLYIEREDKIFAFIYQILPQLQKQATVFYSETFKNMNVRDPRSFTAGVRLNENSHMLEFSFELEGIDREELKYIFDSLREKKKYYRLRNGSFLALDAEELRQLGSMMDYLDIGDKDLEKDMIQLPAYRAMYMDSHLREGNMKNVERNLAFKELVQNIREPGDMEFFIPIKLTNILRDYQKIGFKWLKTLSSYKLGGILADDMGLGKTLQTITFILSEKENGEKNPSLVIAPTSLVYNWKDEVQKFAPELRVLVIVGQQKERQEQIHEIEESDIVITSYPLIRRDVELYENFQFAYCFLDEAQHIKNPDSINAKSVKQIRARSYFALTGTPIENSLTEMWSIFDFIMPGYLFSHSKFIKKYERPIIKEQNQEALSELGKHIRPFILRRMKKDVLRELPEKIESKMTAELTEQQKKIYLAYLEQAKQEIKKELVSNGFEKSHMKILAILTRLRQICCHPALFLEGYEGDSGKMQMLQEIIEDALESRHRILLFSQFTSMLQIIRESLDKQKKKYFYLDGSTKIEERGELVKRFNQGEKDIFLISLKAGGTGLNLTGADMVIHFDPWWNPAVEDQATDRAYRIGQENVVQVMKMITQGTIEEKIYALQQRKKEIIDAVIQPGETMITKMSEQEIKELFEI